MTAGVRITALEEHHRREEFDCGVEALNTYLRQYARQNHEKRIARTFAAVDENGGILGYYSLASASIEYRLLPHDYAKRLPRYRSIPAAIIARLAVDRRGQGKGLGTRLLGDALRRVLLASDEIGIKVVLVDAKDEAAKRFYQGFGFRELSDAPMTLFLPSETIVRGLLLTK